MTTTTPAPVRIRQAVSAVQAAFPSGSGDWAKKRFEAWVTAVEDLDPDAVEIAVSRLIRDWADEHGRPPQPGHLRERAVAELRRRNYESTGDRSGVRFVQAAPDHRDEPGTVRYVVIQPDGTRIPRGVRTVDDMARPRGAETGATIPRRALNDRDAETG